MAHDGKKRNALHVTEIPPAEEDPATVEPFEGL